MICTDHSRSLHKTAGQFRFLMQVQWMTHSLLSWEFSSIKKREHNTQKILKVWSNIFSDSERIFKDFGKCFHPELEQKLQMQGIFKHKKIQLFSHGWNYFDNFTYFILITEALCFIVNQLTFQNYMFLKQNRSLNLKHVNILLFFAKILINWKNKVNFHNLIILHRGKNTKIQKQN